MKLSTLFVAGSVLMSSAFVSANVSYVSGKFDAINKETNTISIIKSDNGEVLTLKYSDNAKSLKNAARSLKHTSLKKGEDITLKLETK